MKSKSPPMTITPMAVARLRPYANNARKHSTKQIRKIAGSIKTFGFVNPVLIGDDDEIIAGHGRLAAAKLLGLAAVPTVRLSHLDDAQRRAYGLADNKLALDAGWDRELLASELRALAGREISVEASGFSLNEVRVVVGGTRASRGEESEAAERNVDREKSEVPSPSPRLRGEGRDEGALTTAPTRMVPTRGETPHPDPLPVKNGEREKEKPVSRADDTWLLGRHRLLCGDVDDHSGLHTILDRLFQDQPLVFIAFDPAQCDRIALHFRHLTGHDATFAETGQSFTEVAAHRGGAAATTA
jgi:hypothetical protein